MTLEATAFGDDPFRRTPTGYEIDVRLPSYRSLPLSCIEGIGVTIAGRIPDVGTLRFRANGDEYTLAQLADRADEQWFVLDPLTIQRIFRRAVLTVLAVCIALFATASWAQVPYFDYEVLEAPAQNGAVALPTVDPAKPDREQWMLQNGKIAVRNVSRPTLTPILPAGPSTGAAVIVAPGGGFLALSMDTEGWQVARWLANHGIAAFVLKYRVTPTPVSNETWENEFNRMIKGEKVSFANPANTPPEALADGLTALRHVRENAGRYGIDPRRVGFMGFSAGGFLTRSMITHGGKDAPDFAAPIYPRMSAMEVPENAPPMFVAIAADDFLLKGVQGFPLVESYRAAGKSIEFHLLANGNHGFGLGRPGTSTDGWIKQFHQWLATSGFLEPKQ